MEFHTLHVRSASLSVLRHLSKKPLLMAYINTFKALNENVFAFVSEYGGLCEKIYQAGDQGQAFLHLIQCDYNSLTTSLITVSNEALEAATCDLETINALIALSGKEFLHQAKRAFPNESVIFEQLPDFSAGSALPFSHGRALAAYYRLHGFGFFAQGTFFTVDQAGKPVLVLHPDPIRLNDLKGYSLQKDKILANTRAFLKNRPSNNVLLYGDKGTGKSSTIKAVVNELSTQGLKIIEMSANQIQVFPQLCAIAAKSPYPIIVFLDDLTFDREDDNFAVLKAFIEGGLTGKPDNMLLYATSNRRHLVRERFSEREGDDIHVRDTLETITSLSDRFGLEITFSVPDKDEYLSIVDQLAEEYGLQLPTDRLHLLAERFAIRRNGRSPRTARQFISDQLNQNNEV